MKVRIIQSIDIEEIPSKLRELLNSTSENMHKSQSLFGNCLTISNINSDSTLKYNLLRQSIEKLRSEIASIDQELSDVDSILEGYVGIIQEPASPPQPRAAPAPPSGEKAPEAPLHTAQTPPPVGKKDANKG